MARVDVNDYDALVKKLEKMDEKRKAQREKIKAAESKKLDAFTDVFDKSFKDDFRKSVLNADNEVLRTAAEMIVVAFDDILDDATKQLDKA